MSRPLLAADTGWRLVLLLAAAAIAFIASLLIGTSGIGVHELLDSAGGTDQSTARSVLLEVRLPRVLAAYGVGALLALCGVFLQALFRNPLADPYVLGVSGGAAVGAVLAMFVGATAFLTQSAAVAGALCAVTAVYLLARGGGTARLLLTGVVLASAFGALVTVLLAVADEARVRGMIFWLAGDLDWASNPWLSLMAACAAVIVAVLLARPLNVLAAGETRARTVGLDFATWRRLIFVLSAILTAIAVVSAGTVGFVGLITPHAIRLMFKTSDHRVVAPAAALLGGTVLAAADLVARTVVSPRQLPVGAIMALIGAPLFIILLRQRSRGA